MLTDKNGSMRHPAVGNSMAGFSLVELMVGMVIALLGTIIIFQVFAVSEGIKRTTTSGGDAQQNGAIALLSLERSIKEAGYGLNATDTRNPIQLTFNASAVPDTLQISSRQGWDYGPFSPDAAAFPSAVPPAITIETLSVNTNAQLISTISGVGATVLSDGIAQMKVMYGTDLDNSGSLSASEWNFNAPADPMTVLAVALGIVARSAQPEGHERANCDTTTTAPTWMSLSFDLTGNVGLANGDSWKCYRYKTFGVIVPMRNVLWK